MEKKPIEPDSKNLKRTVLKIKKGEENYASEHLPKPSWVKIRVPANTNNLSLVKELLKDKKLSTVCSEANCPNLTECFNKKRATFLIMGDICTRRCPYCDIAHGKPQPLDPQEPHRILETAKALNLRYVVLTSVDRDDLKDGGAQHFAYCVNTLKAAGLQVEILVPDFRGRLERALDNLEQCTPDVFNHNIETVPSLYKFIRPGGNYLHSLNLLEEFKKRHPDCPTKTGLMVGVGETDEEVLSVMKDLREVNVDLLTIGQYLAPSKFHLPVKRYVTPEQFENFKNKALEMGFKNCLSGVFVRSSYGAYEQSKS